MKMNFFFFEVELSEQRVFFTGFGFVECSWLIYPRWLYYFVNYSAIIINSRSIEYSMLYYSIIYIRFASRFWRNNLWHFFTILYKTSLKISTHPVKKFTRRTHNDRSIIHHLLISLLMHPNNYELRHSIYPSHNLSYSTRVKSIFFLVFFRL